MDLVVPLLLAGVPSLLVGFYLGRKSGAETATDLVLAAMALHIEREEGSEGRREMLAGVSKILNDESPVVFGVAAAIRKHCHETRKTK
jgi:hypothetical protein